MSLYIYLFLSLSLNLSPIQEKERTIEYIWDDEDKEYITKDTSVNFI